MLQQGLCSNNKLGYSHECLKHHGAYNGLTTLLKSSDEVPVSFLEVRIAEIQICGGSPLPGKDRSSKLSTSASAVGLGINHKVFDQELTSMAPSASICCQRFGKITSALRTLSALSDRCATLSKNTPARLSGNAPPSARIGSVMNLETPSPNLSPSIRPSRDGSIVRAIDGSISTARTQGARRERVSATSNISESESTDGINGWDSPTCSTTSVNITSATTAALAGAEGKLKINQDEKDSSSAEMGALAEDLEWVLGEVTKARIKSERIRHY
ncbi:hypothetical protein EDD21DRAFT_438435 [Dissophora ornata]|nr:hypothetical protein EDD21DRAFT_438435 [Dissophora ornata]